MFAWFFVLRPMLPLALGVAILDEFTRCTRLETGAPLLAALGTAVHRFNVMVHGRVVTGREGCAGGGRVGESS
jgi:hypothetical protein